MQSLIKLAVMVAAAVMALMNGENIGCSVVQLGGWHCMSFYQYGSEGEWVLKIIAFFTMMVAGLAAARVVSSVCTGKEEVWVWAVLGASGYTAYEYGLEYGCIALPFFKWSCASLGPEGAVERILPYAVAFFFVLVTGVIGLKLGMWLRERYDWLAILYGRLP